jgi:hypothetical protein
MISVHALRFTVHWFGAQRPRLPPSNVQIWGGPTPLRPFSPRAFPPLPNAPWILNHTENEEAGVLAR